MKEKNMKRFIYILITIILMVCFLGCDSKTEDIMNEETVLETTEEKDEDIIEEFSENTSEEKTEDCVVEEVVQEERIEEVSEETNQEIVPEENPGEVVEEVSEENIPSYTVEPMEATMYAQRSVNVRIGPGTDYEKIGGLTTNQEVTVTGKASTGWYEISYNDGIGYVSNNYLGDDMVVVEQTPAPTTPEPNNTEVAPEIGTDDWTWDELTTFTIKEVYLEKDMLGLVNGHRSANGIPELTWDTEKEEEALRRAREITQDFSHRGCPSGAAENITFVSIGGNANTYYMNYYNSPGHNKNMLYYSANATSHTMVSATCITVNAAGGEKYYNVLLIYPKYPDNFVTVDWGNLGGTGN
ncbi:MAG: SH3 domain-containing protein [Lachnospiraceae bacterium]|nr:SH3 domain-containing protein [Lachnospiraceae bacterium]